MNIWQTNIFDDDDVDEVETGTPIFFTNLLIFFPNNFEFEETLQFGAGVRFFVTN